MAATGFLFVLLVAVLPLGALGVLILRTWGQALRLFKVRPGRLVAASEWKPLWIGAAGYLLLFIGASAWALAFEPSWVAIEKTRIPVARPILGRRVFRILHLTDLHLDAFGDRERMLLDVARREQPDLILFTGDYVNGREGVADLASLLRRLKSVHGIYGVEGHHDHKFRIAAAFEGAGATLLRDEFVQIGTDGRPLVVAGLSMLPARPLAEVLRAAPEGAFRIVLHHAPDLAERLSPGDADLYLCGHTHGGQIRVPFLGPLLPAWRSEARIPAGESRRGDTVVVLNRGLGMSGGPLPRARLGARPEIRIIELVAP
jgi:hypothetical protein